MRTKYSTDQQIPLLARADDGGAIAITNLLKFHGSAQYAPDAAETSLNLSGKSAYLRYAEAFRALIAEYGGRTLYWGDTIGYAIGQGEWDAVWINHFPSFDALRAASNDPRYAEMHRHRDAGLDYQEAIVTKPETVS